MHYRTLLLDADGTILDFDRSEAEAIRRTLTAYQLPVTEDWVASYHRINDALWKQLERGEISKQDLRHVRFSRLLEHYSVQRDAFAMADTYVEELSSRAYILPGALEACRTLAKTYRLYIITNGIAYVQKKRFASLPLGDCILKSYISEEVGYEKPDICYSLVVGDSLSSDMEGGVRAGIDTCWINPKKADIPSHLPIKYSIQTIADLPALLLRNEETCL